MSDPNQPTPADGVTPLTTAAQLSAVARETLYSTTGTARLSTLAREALISGVLITGARQNAVTIISS